MSRRGKEFSSYIKHSVFQRANGICEICHENIITEYHHILFLCIAAKYYPSLAPAVLTSINNCLGVCNECHKEIHKHPPSKKENEKQARKINNQKRLI